MNLHGFLPIDKPSGWTSHDVVARLRRIIGTKRIGHAGTLDPAATGVLVTGIGRATRFLDFVQEGHKEYVAHVVLDTETDTADVDGRIQRSETRHPAPSHEQVTEALTRFVGDIDQIPPKYSAIKQGGEPIYRKARRGEQVEVSSRRVCVHDLTLLSYRHPDLVFSVSCSAGLYVRSLARDLGVALGTSAYLHHLLRTSVGPFVLDQCWSLERFSDAFDSDSWPLLATSVDTALLEMTAFAMSGTDSTPWYHGRPVPLASNAQTSDETVRAYDSDGRFAGIGTAARHGNQASVNPRTVITLR